MAYVLKDTSNSSDSVDVKVRETQNKRIKLCTAGHENWDVRSNRKKCQYCKARLVEDDAHDHCEPSSTPQSAASTNVDLSPEEECALYYMHVDNISTEYKPVDKSMGAIPVNPNNVQRIKKVLDDIKSKTGLDKYYSVELRIENDKLIKILIQNPETRSWILLSCDGLPMKSLIQLIENTFQCVDCGERLEHVSELGEHTESTNHKTYFQPYSCFVPNVGQFHYQMTMNRSYIKLLWKIEYEKLFHTINLSSPGTV